MDKTTELLCLIDDFCQQFEPLLGKHPANLTHK